MYEDEALAEIREQGVATPLVRRVLADARRFNDLRKVQTDVKRQGTGVASAIHALGRVLDHEELAQLEKASEVIGSVVAAAEKAVRMVKRRAAQMTGIHEQAVQRFADDVQPPYLELSLEKKAAGLAPIFGKAYLQADIGSSRCWADVVDLIEREWRGVLRQIALQYGADAALDRAVAKGAARLEQLDEALSSAKDLHVWTTELIRLRLTLGPS